MWRGQLGFSVLLFQDIAVIPALSLIPFFSGGYGDWIKISIKLAAFFGILVGGCYLLRPLFRHIAKAIWRGVFTIASLLLVLRAALFMDLLGLSMAIGAFIAGVLLAGVAILVAIKEGTALLYIMARLSGLERIVRLQFAGVLRASARS